jgi:hypothetical protein
MSRSSWLPPDAAPSRYSECVGTTLSVSSFAKTAVGLLVLLVVLVVALLLEGSTHSAIAAWVAVGSLLAVLFVRWLLLMR